MVEATTELPQQQSPITTAHPGSHPLARHPPTHLLDCLSTGNVKDHDAQVLAVALAILQQRVLWVGGGGGMNAR